MKDYRQRYGDPELYVLHCSKAHHSTGQRCVLCTKKSEEIHHAYYVGGNKDEVGINTFPVCRSCHTSRCHDSGVWYPHHDHMKSRNNDEFIFHLRSRYLFVSQVFSCTKGNLKYAGKFQSKRKKT
jgi:hypothetical protein